MQSRLDFRSPLTLFLLGIALYVIFGIVWWNDVYTAPKKTFDDMLVNSLTTSSVTKNEFISSKQGTSLQRITLVLGGENAARSLVTLRSGDSSVTTETISTPKAAYVRYVDITDAKKHNYATATNVWAKASKNDKNNQLNQLFEQSLLDVTALPVPPVGYVHGDKRQELLTYMQNEDVFTPDYKTVKTDTINGRKVYVYNVSVKLAPYLRMMQVFSHVYGLHGLDSVNAGDYQSQPPVTMSVAVDKLSHQMVRVAASDNTFNETYTDYGIERHIPIPTKAITTQQLQQRLKASK